MGLIITDGHIDKSLHWTQFVSNEEKLRILFKNYLTEIFNYDRSYTDSKNPTVIYVKNQTISKLFWILGIPKGKKFHIVSVPEYIFDCDEVIIKSFVRGCLDGDGSVSYTPRLGLRIINYATNSKHMAQDISTLLLTFDIKNSVSKNIKNMYYINITGMKNIQNFEKEIGFNHPRRSEKLHSILKSYVKKP